MNILNMERETYASQAETAETPLIAEITKWNHGEKAAALNRAIRAKNDGTFYPNLAPDTRVIAIEVFIIESTAPKVGKCDDCDHYCSICQHLDDDCSCTCGCKKACNCKCNDTCCNFVCTCKRIVHTRYCVAFYSDWHYVMFLGNALRVPTVDMSQYKIIPSNNMLLHIHAMINDIRMTIKLTIDKVFPIVVGHIINYQYECAQAALAPSMDVKKIAELEQALAAERLRVAEVSCNSKHLRDRVYQLFSQKVALEKQLEEIHVQISTVL